MEKNVGSRLKGTYEQFAFSMKNKGGHFQITGICPYATTWNASYFNTWH